MTGGINAGDAPHGPLDRLHDAPLDLGRLRAGPGDGDVHHGNPDLRLLFARRREQGERPQAERGRDQQRGEAAVEERVRDGQLDECSLTISELARIRESFIPVLTAIFHVRAPYPTAPKREGKREMDARRDA